MSMAICMWSGPRNLSTAMMRSFGSRDDCAVWDEPFFAPFLKVSGKAHPGREETLARHETDPDMVAAGCAAEAPGGQAFYFQKHMPHHMLDGFPLEWAKDAKHFFLIRDPRRVIASYIKGRGAFTIEDLGYRPQVRLMDRIAELTGSIPPIVDCDDILRAPEAVLTVLCERLGMPFDAQMLKWDAGPRDTDGAWAPYWYGSVERSTGFTDPPSAFPDVPEEHAEVLAECQVDYDKMHRLRLQV